MKFLFLVLTVTAAVQARPSYLAPYLKFSDDGGSFSYSFQTPAIQHVVQPLVRSQYVQEVLPASRSVIIGPAVSYHGIGYSAVPAVAKHVEPANIQVSGDGFVLDTPEVAQAKAAHLAQVAQESARAASSPAESEDDGSYDDDTVEVGAPVQVVKSAQPIVPANIQVSADGFVLDTPEVAQAKAEHEATFNAIAKAAAAAPDDYVEPNDVPTFSFAQPINVVAPAVQTYHIAQPIAKPVEIADIKVSSDGHVLDTPEVAQAKALHFAKYNEAAAAAAAQPDTEDYNNENHVYVAPVAVAQPVHVYSAAPIIKSVPIHLSTYAVNTGAIITKKFDDPPADIKVSADGFVQDTPEVAHAKAAHLAKLAEVGTTDDDQAYSSGPAIAYTVSAVQPKWTGPEANIQVGHDGYLVDTPEVQQARAEHLATRSQIMANSGSEWSGASSRYATFSQQPVQDTAEVSAARAAHLQAYAQELAKHSTKSQALNYGQLVYSAPVVTSHAVAYSAPLRYLHFRYAPVAHVALTPDGQYLLDTPEVAAAKAEHFAAHARALH